MKQSHIWATQRRGRNCFQNEHHRHWIPVFRGELSPTIFAVVIHEKNVIDDDGHIGRKIVGQQL